MEYSLMKFAMEENNKYKSLTLRFDDDIYVR